MREEVLRAIDSDLRAAGLSRLRAERLIGHRDFAGLATDDEERQSVGLADPEPYSAATADVLELRAAAEFAQAMLVETSYRQWPVCRRHENRMLSPLIRDGVPSWVCGTNLGAGSHEVTAIGALSDAGEDIGYR